MSSSQENHNKIEKKKNVFIFFTKILSIHPAMSAIQNVHLTKRCLHKRKGPMCLII